MNEHRPPRKPSPRSPRRDAGGARHGVTPGPRRDAEGARCGGPRDHGAPHGAAGSGGRPGGPPDYGAPRSAARGGPQRAFGARRAQPSGPSFFAVTPHGLEDALAAELHALGIRGTRIVPGGVSFPGTLADGYTVCLWARTAERVLLELARFPATGREQIYNGVRAVDWTDHLTPRTSIACQAIGTTPILRNSHYTALVVKDAVVDFMRDRFGERPMVNVRRPDVRLQLLLRAGWAVLSLDLAGDALHRRGYRTPGRQAQAPLKETLAAGMLTIAGWPQMANTAGFVDPLCGSGTLPLEAALMAADTAPGLLRQEWGFLRWRGHDEAAWRRAVDEATERRAAGTAALSARARDLGLPPVMGFDNDPRAIALARSAILRAGLSGMVAVEVQDVHALRNPFAAGQPQTAHVDTGLVATNPPYGERLRGPNVDRVYRDLGDTLRTQFDGWRAAVLLADEERAAQIGAGGVRPAAELHNGPIACTLVRFEIGERPRPAETEPGDVAEEAVVLVRTVSEEEEALGEEPGIEAGLIGKPEPVEEESLHGAQPEPQPPAGSPAIVAAAPMPGDFADAAQQFADRLRRNLRVLGRPLRRRGVDCFRVYDADLPDFNMAVDLYADWAHVQEYQAPAEIDPAKAAARLQAALSVLPATLDIDARHMVVKTRQRQRGTDQYERLATTGDFLEVHEGAATYLVHLTDHIDTGLFLHQRLLRELVASMATDASFLNLFGYTGTATVAAALGGAFNSLTVDLSASYLDWAQRNFRRNGLDPALHGTVHADCLRWLREAATASQRFDLILLGPPTFSNSTSMGSATLDVQRDHIDLIQDAARLLTRDGVLLFVCGAHRFSFAADELQDLAPQDLSKRTLPADFARRAADHHVWRLSAPVPGAGGKAAAARRERRAAEPREYAGHREPGKRAGRRERGEGAGRRERAQHTAGERAPAGRDGRRERGGHPERAEYGSRRERGPAGRSGAYEPAPEKRGEERRRPAASEKRATGRAGKRRHTRPPWEEGPPPGAEPWMRDERPARKRPPKPGGSPGGGGQPGHGGGPKGGKPGRSGGKTSGSGSGWSGGKTSGGGSGGSRPPKPGAGSRGGKPSGAGGQGRSSFKRRDQGTGGTSRRGASRR